MKHLLALFLLLFSVGCTTAQLKIDTNYALMINDTAYKNGSYAFSLGPDNIAVKEVVSGKSCAIVSAEWTFIIRGNIFHDTKAGDIKTHLELCKPKDKLFIEKIKLTNGCFIPPRQIIFGVL